MSAEPVIPSEGSGTETVPSLAVVRPRGWHGVSFAAGAVLLVAGAAVPVVGLALGTVMVLRRRSPLGAVMIAASTISTIWYAAAYLQSR